MSGGATVMEDVFLSFCAFGTGMKDAGALMDGSKFSKFCRDCKIFDKKLTTIDADIIFAQVKPKTERKINYDQFLNALEIMANKKYRGESDSVHLLHSKILEARGPSVSGTTQSLKTEAVERMTDASQYTGSHKERFDDSGKGRGLEGRGVQVGAHQGYVLGYKNEGSYKGAKVTPGTQNTPSPKQKRAGPSVTDRLTDSSKYTGSHKHRFDSSGQGLGAAGRDLPAKGTGMTAGSVAGQAAYVSGYKNEGTYERK